MGKKRRSGVPSDHSDANFSSDIISAEKEEWSVLVIEDSEADFDLLKRQLDRI